MLMLKVIIRQEVIEVKLLYCIINEMLFLSSRIGECMKCLLKIFGILTINEIVPYREHPNPKFAYVYYGKGWHTVPIEDIKIL